MVITDPPAAEPVAPVQQRYAHNPYCVGDLIIVSTIGLCCLCAGGGMTVLVILGKAIPPELSGLAGGSLSALVSLLFRRQS